MTRSTGNAALIISSTELVDPLLSVRASWASGGVSVMEGSKRAGLNEKLV